MNWLRIGLYAFVVAAIASAVMLVRAHWIGVGQARIQARWDAQKVVDDAETLRRERQANAEQLARFKNAERNADEQANREAARSQRDAALGRRLAGLRATIAALNRRPLPAPSDDAGVAALAGEAATARELLGRCSERYRTVASAADELRDQVIGLQADAATVCRGSAGMPNPNPATQ